MAVLVILKGPLGDRGLRRLPITDGGEYIKVVLSSWADGLNILLGICRTRGIVKEEMTMTMVVHFRGNRPHCL